MSKTGILGGSFDPVHLGHLMMAQSVMEETGLDDILFIPAGRNPFKPEQTKAHRLECYDMLQLATADNPRFQVSRCEIDREGKSYTCDTIRALQKEKPGEYAFILGSDLLFELDQWKDAEALLTMVSFIVVERPGDSRTAIDQQIDMLHQKFGADIKLCRTRRLEISSTIIRRRIRDGLPIRYFTTPEIVSYIQKNGLYKKTEPQINHPMDHCTKKTDNRYLQQTNKKTGDKPADVFVSSAQGEQTDCMRRSEQEAREKLRRQTVQLKNNLKHKRFVHTLGVVKTAGKLAQRYGEDVGKARTAALLHDCAKRLSMSEMLALFKKHGEVPEPAFMDAPQTLHAPAGALLVQDEYDEHDPDILSAIASHTTGNVHMSKLDKIIYLADYMEPGRTQPGVDHVRQTAETNLDAAVLETLENCIAYLQRCADTVHPYSLAALAELKQQEKQGTLQ